MCQIRHSLLFPSNHTGKVSIRVITHHDEYSKPKRFLKQSEHGEAEASPLSTNIKLDIVFSLVAFIHFVLFILMDDLRMLFVLCNKQYPADENMRRLPWVILAEPKSTSEAS
ncbi:hypothetical protein AB990_20495 [Alkalihalobacillus pseudalcaliphilus]|nr:hypothetical protein AB990_20495 [Alkalihalobacillus pseudalcaliphilus]